MPSGKKSARAKVVGRGAVGDEEHLLPGLNEEEEYEEQEEKRTRKRRKASAPTDYLIFNNPDKTDYIPPPEDNPCQPAHPSRIIVIGQPGCGKRSVLYNILENYGIDFDKVTEVHASARSGEHDVFEDAADYELRQWDNSTDSLSEPYKLIGPPDQTRFEGKGPNGETLHHVLIMDEPPCEWPAALKRDVTHLMNYVSTHYHTTVFLITQHFQSLPVQIREAASHLIFFPSQNRDIVRFWSRRAGVDLQALFDRFCRSKYDSIMVDKTGDGPRIRRNVYEPIEMGSIEKPLGRKEIQAGKGRTVKSLKKGRQNDYDR